MGILRRDLQGRHTYNIKAIVDQADNVSPKLNDAFLEYMQSRGFVADLARIRSPKDKARVERMVGYVKVSFFKGEDFRDIEDAQTRAELWCLKTAGLRIHRRTRRRRGVKGLVIGSDGRASTSKVQPVLWTLAVFYALVFLLLWGRSVGCDSGFQTPACVEASRARDAFTRTLDAGLQPEYYVLLGFPFAAAVAAKAMTSAKAADNTLDKPQIKEGQRGFVQGLTEVVSNDSGETDLLDFQYFAFNLLTLAFFLIEFLGNPALGFPTLPPMLVALSGLATATYTTKKTLETKAWERSTQTAAAGPSKPNEPEPK